MYKPDIADDVPSGIWAKNILSNLLHNTRTDI
jgi:hypothetical protein